MDGEEGGGVISRPQENLNPDFPNQMWEEASGRGTVESPPVKTQDNETPGEFAKVHNHPVVGCQNIVWVGGLVWSSRRQERQLIS